MYLLINSNGNLSFIKLLLIMLKQCLNPHKKTKYVNI